MRFFVNEDFQMPGIFYLRNSPECAAMTLYLLMIAIFSLIYLFALEHQFSKIFGRNLYENHQT